MTSSAPSTSTGLPGVDGTCGKQHDNAICFKGSAQLCCSINGYCGSDEYYCLVSNGCQSGCKNESDFSSTSLTISSSTSSTISLPSKSSTSTALTSSATSSTIHTTTSSAIATQSATNGTSSHHLSKGAKAGAIAGGTVGGIALIFLLLIVLRLWWGRRHGSSYHTGPNTRPGNRVVHEE